jgi:protein ImuA
MLDAQLPGRGWPQGALIELMPCHEGIGELALLQPALRQLPQARSIFLLNPPHPPHFHCWLNWQLAAHRLLWLAPQNMADTLWSAEQILRHDACAALLCWASLPRLTTLRRLQLAARQSQALFFMLRPPSAARQPSAAELRLALYPTALGLDIHILKRKGPACEQTISLALHPARPAKTYTRHVSLDQPVPDYPQPGRQFSALAS